MKITIQKSALGSLVTVVTNHLALKQRLETKQNEEIELRDRISALIESGKDDEESVKALIDARARLDLLPSQIDQLERAIAQSRESIKKELLPHFQFVGQKASEIRAAERARLEKILSENVEDTVARKEMLDLAMPSMPDVRAAYVLACRFGSMRMVDYCSGGNDPVGLALEMLQEFGVTIEEPKQDLVPA
jgi:hypothetical protein